jgi:hypothetical protein
MDYLDLYEIVAKYYPIGISDNNPSYLDFSGYRNLRSLCEKKGEQGGDDTWKSFLVAFKSKSPRILSTEIISQRYHPCFSASFQISFEKTETITYTRELQTHVSLLGPAFTIFGVETVTINQLEATLNPLIIISPISAYEEYFISARQFIGDYYPKYQFVPFMMLENRVPGLRVNGADNEQQQDSSFFQALFTYENITNFPTEGDFFYV